MAEAEAEIKNQLGSELNNWRKSVNAPVPNERNPHYNPEFENNLIKEKTYE